MISGYIDLVRNEIRNQKTERLGASSWMGNGNHHFTMTLNETTLW